MFRVTTESTFDHLLLRFEGRLSGDWVNEAQAACERMVASLPSAVVVIDLCEVSGVDAGGRALLARLHRAGVEFKVRGCVMRELVREIADKAKVAGDDGVANTGTWGGTA